MATGAQAARARRIASGWKWPLLALCAFEAVWIAAAVIDLVGLKATPWYGWWDATWHARDVPYTIRFDTPLAGGASAGAGIQRGDQIDLREQPLGDRLRLSVQPMAKQQFNFLVRTNGRPHEVHLFPGTFWGTSPLIKLSQLISELAYSIWFLGCAILIAFRRAELPEGRTLTLVLLATALTWCQIVVPNDAATTILFAIPPLLDYLALALLVRLTAQFGARGSARRVFEGVAYAIIALNVLEWVVFYYGLVTLRFDPLPFGIGGIPGGALTPVLTAASLVSVLVVAAAAVMTSARNERARAGWLLLPLPIALAAGGASALLGNVVQGWIEYQLLYLASCLFYFFGALALTYAVLNRRVLDIEFVLSRTLVVATLSLIVVVCFVLLEFVLGIFVSDASHTAGIVANATLALALGLFMRYIHQRVDGWVDFLLLRKRHEDERALLEFGKEAAYVTDQNALLDQTLAKLQRHTDARSAAVMLDGAGVYEAARSFGDGIPPKVSENDPVVLAFKAWHRALDPDKYDTAMHGDLALPMLARGHLLGMLVLGERSGGEAYAPDELEALSQLTDGVGAALDALRNRNADSFETLEQSLTSAFAEAATSMNDAMRALPDAIAARLRPPPEEQS